MFEWREEKMFYEMADARCIPKLLLVYFMQKELGRKAD
jgi:hypothetical protein